jgi:threonine synthase
MRALVFLPAGKVAAGKLAQALAYGATTVAVNGDFDRAMDLVKQASRDLGIYLVNSVNPFRIEGQKTIIWEMLEQFSWNPPDWIVVPGGNLGNTSAFGKALREAHAAGWITRLPRLAVVQATGANPFYQSFLRGFDQIAAVAADTVASAIRIGNPVNYAKARKVIQATSGVVTQVTDEEILAAKAAIDGAGLGCEPASACSLAGLRRLASEGVVRKTDSVVAILTGHVLKDADIIPKSLQYGQQQQKSLTLENSLDPLREFLKG